MNFEGGSVRVLCYATPCSLTWHEPFERAHERAKIVAGELLEHDLLLELDVAAIPLQLDIHCIRIANVLLDGVRGLPQSSVPIRGALGPRLLDGNLLAVEDELELRWVALDLIEDPVPDCL